MKLSTRSGCACKAFRRSGVPRQQGRDVHVVGMSEIWAQKSGGKRRKARGSVGFRGITEERAETEERREGAQEEEGKGGCGVPSGRRRWE